MAARRSQQPAGDELGRYVSARKAREKQQGPPVMQPPLTPMIDVVFQLLLFFLLGCQFIQDEGQLKANLPRTRGIGPAPTMKVYLRPAGPDGVGVLAEVPLLHLATSSMPALHEGLERFMRRPEADRLSIIIQPVGKVRWQHVVNAFNQASRAGCTRVGFAPPRPRRAG